MRNGSGHESKLWKVVEEEALGDLSQFHRPGFSDEVPLFSRAATLEFLPAGKEGDLVVLRFALKFLRSVVAYEEHARSFFAAITIWSFAVDPLVPNIFFWNGSMRDLKQKLQLRSPHTVFGERMDKLLHKIDAAHHFKIGEDGCTMPDASRVFIAPARSPYAGFATLDSFARLEKAAK